jgi:hypothetical protein
MSQPDVRKGMPPRRLGHGAFEQRFKSAFVDPVLRRCSASCRPSPMRRGLPMTTAERRRSPARPAPASPIPTMRLRSTG